jgi:hypothetical protein
MKSRLGIGTHELLHFRIQASLETSYLLNIGVHKLRIVMRQTVKLMQIFSDSFSALI